MLYKCFISGVESTDQYQELIKEFLRPDQYEMTDKDGEGVYFTYKFMGNKNLLKRQIFTDLRQVTGKRPKWGILTGIRPVKLAGEIYRSCGSIERVREILEGEYLLHEEKSSLTCDILEYQMKYAGVPEADSLSMYIGIPFCPTRCLYCSFTSNHVEDIEATGYLEALYREMDYTAREIKNRGLKLESVYIGGGTPTTLSFSELNEFLAILTENFDMKNIREFTVEAGRPDTITEKKLCILKKHGVSRISINPQTMNDKTLKAIGRRHSVEDVIRGFKAAASMGIEVINSDLIAGLPGEETEDFDKSLQQIMGLGANNITLHTLAVKRASRLKEIDSDYNYKNESICEEMLSVAHKRLTEEGYVPYYLYRQKHTSGNTENTGFCIDHTLSIYNVRMMEEAQSIVALGAGGISKVYFPKENRLERVANVSNYEIYTDRIEEMIERKRRGFFLEK